MVLKKKIPVRAAKKSATDIKKSESTAAKSKPQAGPKLAEFVFGRENYKLLLIGLAFIITGFVLMVGGGSDDPNVFRYDIFNFRRWTLAPVLILIGYVIEIYAIMKRSKD